MSIYFLLNVIYINKYYLYTIIEVNYTNNLEIIMLQIYFNNFSIYAYLLYAKFMLTQMLMVCLKITNTFKIYRIYFIHTK